MSVLERFPVGDTGHRGGRRTWRPPRPWDTDRAVRDRVYTPSSCVAEAESSFAASDFVSRGSAFAALGYGLAPRHRLDEIVTMVRKGVRYLHRHATALGVDSRRIFLSGSSAGAHLAAMCLLEGWLAEPLRPQDVVRGATLLSGVYELEPLGHTYIGEAIGLGVGEASRNSPIRHLPPGLPPLIVARAGVETEAFADQHDDLVNALLQLGAPVADLVVPGRNHFDLPLGLGDQAGVLGRAVLAQMELTVVTEKERG